MSLHTAVVLTISDSVSAGNKVDSAGPKVVERLKQNAVRVETLDVLPDEHDLITAKLVELCDNTSPPSLIVTVGGTGFGPRDVTPEATRAVVDKEAPGLVHAMFASSFKVTPYAAMSRLAAGARKRTLIVNVPGSSKGSVENLDAILPVLNHALKTLCGTEHLHHDARATLANGGCPSSQTAPVSETHAAHHGHNHGHHHHHHHTHAHDHHHHNLHPDKSNNNNNNNNNANEDGGATTGGRARVRKSPFPMISYEEALATVMHHSKVLDTERVTLADAHGATLAANVRAEQPLPPFRASTMDGYAVVSSDGAGTYPVVGSVTAGTVLDARLLAGSVAQIMTGAPLPEGADAVQMIEKTAAVEGEDEDKMVEILESVRAGQFVRPVGCDIAQGEMVLEKGARIGAAEIGLLASVGVSHVDVVRTPTVGILSTGDELVEASESPDVARGQIRDSNRPMLVAAARRLGCRVLDLGMVRDREGHLEQGVLDALDRADVVVTSGGVSMGELDLLKPLLANRGTIHFGRVRLKPGKPTTFATVNRPRTTSTSSGGEFDVRLVFALPGNPVSAMVTFHLFVEPCLRQLGGTTQAQAPRVRVRTADAIYRDPVRVEFHRARLEYDSTRGEFVAHSTGAQFSSRLASMRSANALLVIDSVPTDKPGDNHLPAGSLVDALLVGDL